MGDTEDGTIALLSRGNYAFKENDWKYISEDAKALIRSLLQMRPENRYEGRQVVENIWVSNVAPNARSVNLRPVLMKLRGNHNRVANSSQTTSTKTHEENAH